MKSHDGPLLASSTVAEVSIGREVISMAGEDSTMWLNITNFALGIVTLVALLVVFFAVGWDLLVRKVGRAPVQVDWNHLDADLKAQRRPSRKESKKHSA